MLAFRAAVSGRVGDLAPKKTWRAASGPSSLETVWTIEDEPPVDPEARELSVTLAASGPRWASPDGECAISSASLENGRPLTLCGALGHVAAGESIVVAG